jgi:DNA mismatch repair ATPase MutL
LIYYSPGDRELKHAVLSVYGKDVIDQILPLEPIDTAIGVKLWGLVGKPSLSRKNRSHQSFFVNRRYVKSKLLEESVAAAYKPYLTINQFPWIVLHIDIEPNKIDVNVHPAKTEIRFRDEDEIGQIIQYNIGAALEENPYIPTIKEDTFITFDTNGVDGDKSQQLEVFPTIPIDWDRDKDEKNEYTRNIYASKYSEAKDYSYDTGRNPVMIMIM